MKKRNKLMVVAFICWSIAMLFGLLLVSKCEGEEKNWVYGITLYYGVEDFGMTHPSEGYDYTAFSLKPFVGKYLNSWLSANIEGSIGEICFHDVDAGTDSRGIEIGISILFKADMFKIKKMITYSEAGVGIGLSSGSPSNNTLGHNPTGLIHAGLGIKYPIPKRMYFIVGYRFTHESSMFGRDAGINHHGINIGIQW